MHCPLPGEDGEFVKFSLLKKTLTGEGLSFGDVGFSLSFCTVLSFSPATGVVLHVGVQGVPEGKLCAWRD